MEPEDIVCPFCKETEFDRIGLKIHLHRHCEAYERVGTERHHDWTPDAERESRHWDAIVNDDRDAEAESVKADDGK